MALKPFLTTAASFRPSAGMTGVATKTPMAPYGERWKTTPGQVEIGGKAPSIPNPIEAARLRMLRVSERNEIEEWAKEHSGQASFDGRILTVNLDNQHGPLKSSWIRKVEFNTDTTTATIYIQSNATGPNVKQGIKLIRRGNTRLRRAASYGRSYWYIVDWPTVKAMLEAMDEAKGAGRDKYVGPSVGATYIARMRIGQGGAPRAPYSYGDAKKRMPLWNAKSANQPTHGLKSMAGRLRSLIAKR